MRPLRKAILAGYATKLARRMPQHNGYKTVGPRGNLAQLHPSCAKLTPDEDGMLPQWLVYHELLQTARTFISKASCTKLFDTTLTLHALLPKDRLEGQSNFGACVVVDRTLISIKHCY